MATITLKKTKLGKTKTGKQLILCEKQYELFPEIWEIVKEYLLPKEDPLITAYPVKIGDGFKITDMKGSVVWWKRIVPPEEYFDRKKKYCEICKRVMTKRECVKSCIWFKPFATAKFEKRKRYREVVDDYKISIVPIYAYEQLENKDGKTHLPYTEIINTKTTSYELVQYPSEPAIVEHVKF